MLNYDSWTFLSFARRFQMLAFFKGHAWLPPRVREAWACCVLWLACSFAPKVLGHCLRFFRRFFPSTFGVSVNLDFIDRPLTLKHISIRNGFSSERADHIGFDWHEMWTKMTPVACLPRRWWVSSWRRWIRSVFSQGGDIGEIERCFAISKKFELGPLIFSFWFV